MKNVDRILSAGSGLAVLVWLDPAVEKWSKNRSRSEDHNFERMCVFRSETERRGIFVVKLVNMFVEQGRVEKLMSCGQREVRQYSSEVGASTRWSTNRNSETCPKRKKRTRVAGSWFATTGKAPAKCSCQRTQRRGGRRGSVEDRIDPVGEQINENEQRTSGKLRDDTSRSERRLLLLNSGHSGMTLLGSAQHQRLIDPKKSQHHDKACWRNKGVLEATITVPELIASPLPRLDTLAMNFLAAAAIR